MNAIFKPLIDRGVVAIYMDEHSCFHRHSQTTHAVVREVLKILRDNTYFLKPEKCVFHQSEVEYLGLIVGTNKPEWTNQNIRNSRLACTKKKQELQTFSRFFAISIVASSKTTPKIANRTILTRDMIEWTPIQQTAFQTLINAITTQPVLALLIHWTISPRSRQQRLCYWHSIISTTRR